MTLPSCSCRELVPMIHHYYSDGKILRNAQFDIVGLSVQEIRGITAAADVQYLDHAAQVIGQNGRLFAEGRERAAHNQLSMVRTAKRRWLVSQSVDLTAK